MKKIISLLFISLILVSAAQTASRKPVKAKHGMVVSADPLASKVGVEILKQGGNAVDAAVAVGFALAVTYPAAGNIGGGGFMNIRLADGRCFAIDYREKAPGKAHRDMFLDSAGNFVEWKSTFGHLAAGVPGAVAGMLLGLEKFGTFDRKKVITPAYTLAIDGFPVLDELARDLNSERRAFEKFSGSKKYFVSKDSAFKEGDIWKQTDLAKTLKRIIENGRDGFYKGETADLIVTEIKRGGGLITHSDLENYNAIIRQPLKGTYRGYEIIAQPPVSSGGTALLQLLNMLEGYDLKSYGHNSAATVHRYIEAMRRIYADRAEHLGDPEFYKVPVHWLISKEYANERRATIATTKASPSKEVTHGKSVVHESEQTTHYSVVDKWGNCVSVTTTLNGGFGCDVAVDGAGFLLNNEMDDFSAKPGVPNMFGAIGNIANEIQPNKRMLSSMTPTIVVKDGKPFMVIGTPGGTTIITTVMQVICNVIDFEMNIQQAIDAPRIHHQWSPDITYFEKRGLSADTIEKLKAMGHNLQERRGTSGLAEGIIIDSKTGFYYGATDPRGYGLAAGY
ncbi:MAG: gamma-glutamyltransferase [Ignavibacteriales bacterium]|nr:gamma-glutamyltransferase [Ignavibacteriales bacterium]